MEREGGKDREEMREGEREEEREKERERMPKQRVSEWRKVVRPRKCVRL